MDVVIDAQLIGWYYQSHELDTDTPCSCSPAKLVDRLGGDDIGVLDRGGNIESEWRKQADDDWFDAWLAQRFQLGDIVEIDIETCPDLLRKLRIECGFPAGSGDKWYVRTARSRARNTGKVVALLSEDLDFYEPKAKGGGGNRGKILKTCSGCVAKCLRKVDVDPRTALAHIA